MLHDNRTLRKNAVMLRRQLVIALASDISPPEMIDSVDESESDDSLIAEKLVELESRQQLLALRAAVVLTPRKVHLFQGYTAHYEQYWQVRIALPFLLVH